MAGQPECGQGCFAIAELFFRICRVCYNRLIIQGRLLR